MSTDKSDCRQRAAATKRARTQRAILDAASRLFNEYGYDGVRLDDVAIEAGVGTATISNHFPTKRDLAIAAYVLVLRPIVDKAETALVNETKASSAVISFIRELAVAVDQSPALAVALLPAGRDIGYTRTTLTSDELSVVDFDQLADLLGRLLDEHWKRGTSSSGFASDAAEFFLLGLLSRIVKHPEQSGGISAEITLAYLL